ncbi:MAG: response regulator transcription factor [Actinobacteria bacterium]|nr:response regulator transcription factor [Actinomycetota bacterium]MCA1721701.1 response regulator transcription factor [Actinomycetota bacterium]
MSIRVVVADDHAPTRMGVRLSLEEAGFHVCADVADAEAAIRACETHRPDVALLDIHMPGNGIEAAKRLAALVPETAVVMLTVSRDDVDLFDALRAGARGYLLKDIDPGRLGPALRGVLDGEAALPRNLVARLMTEFRTRDERPRPSGPLAKLTQREWETLDQMRQGLNTAQIAEQLSVSPVTIRTYVSAILRKLHVHDRQSAIDVAERH